MSQSLNTKNGFQLVLTDTYLCHYSSDNFLRIPKASIKHVRIVPEYQSKDSFTLKVDDCSLFSMKGYSHTLPAYNLITEWLLNDSVQPVLQTLEG